MTIWIEDDLCNGCKRCVKACPYDALEMAGEKAHILARCTSCGACLEVCKQKAIQSDMAPREIPDFEDRRGVWVFVEHRDGEINRVCLELLGKAVELSLELRQDVSAVLVGNRVSQHCQTLIDYGADNVYLTEHRALAGYRTQAYTSAIAQLIKQYKPSILLIGATNTGRDLAPRLSRKVGVGLTADCTELSIDPEEGILLQTRPAFGGNVMATIANRYSRPQMATVRPGVMKALEKKQRQGKAITCKFSITENEIGTKVLDVVREKKKAAKLNEAKVIIAAGRGVGSKAGMKTLSSLAALMGAELAGTRIIVEAGWLPVDRQIGQTGQTVRPEIYIACGISGAIQHRAGMVGSRFIIAINKDERAPIFEIADWGIVGDLHQVIPAITNAIKQSKINE